MRHLKYNKGPEIVDTGKFN